MNLETDVHLVVNSANNIPDDNTYSDVEDTVDRVEKSRERNREHAKKTRLRKKAMLENLKARLLELQAESARLQQALEENNTANILLCLGTKPEINEPADEVNVVETESSNPAVSANGNIIDHLRSIVRAEAAIFLKPKLESSSSSQRNNFLDDDGNLSDDDEEINDASKALDGSKNWKNGSVIPTGSEKTSEGVELIRKERNRMHAKLTRDRKKMFTSRLQQLIAALERQNTVLKSRLQGAVKRSDPQLQPAAQPLPLYAPLSLIPHTLPLLSSPSFETFSRLPLYESSSPSLGISSTMTMAPSINVNAYAPVSLKRKSYEAFSDNAGCYQQLLHHYIQNHQQQHSYQG